MHDPIKKSSLVLFRKPHCKTNSAQGKRTKVLQNNVALCGQLYVSMQNRDSDFAGSLKESTREKRGKGLRMKVSGETKLPRNWVDFLRNSANKKELFALLTSKVEEFIWPSDKDVYVTSGQALSSFGCNSPMNSCNHEEADNKVAVHVLHALQQGLKIVQVRTVG